MSELSQSASKDFIEKALTASKNGQNVQLKINVDGSVGGLETGHVQIGVSINGQPAQWFGYSPTGDDLTGWSAYRYTTGDVKGQYIGEDYASASAHITPLILSNDFTQTALVRMAQKIDAGQTDYQLTQNDCFTNSKGILDGSGYNLNRIVSESGAVGAVVNQASAIEMYRIAREAQIMADRGVKDFNNPKHCYPASTLITLADNAQTTIDKIAAGSRVATFDPNANLGRGALLSGTVTRLFTNITQEFYILKNAAANGVVFNSTVTGGHLYLGTDGLFAKIEDIVQRDCSIVLSDGMVIRIAFERVVYSEATAHLYPQAERMVCATEGGLAVAPKMERGWATYNFEVATHHVYIADNARVHNESVLDLVPNDAMPYNANGTLNPNASVLVTGYEADGITPKSAVYTDAYNKIHFLDTSHNAGGVVLLNEKIVTTSNDGTLEHSYVAYDINRDANTGNKVSANGYTSSGNAFFENFDPAGILTSYVFKKPDGAELTLTGENIGKVLGSSIGNALGGKNAFTKVSASLLIGATGKTLGGFFSARGNPDGSLIARFTDGKTPFDAALGEALNDLSANLTKNIVPDVISGLSSLMVVELADALHLNGFTKEAFTQVSGAYLRPDAANNNGYLDAKDCG